VIITMVGVPADVEEVYLGESGIVRHAKEGALLVDMTTSSPQLAARIAEAASARGQRALDAPVSGGERGAKEAALSIMVGGDEGAFNDALPILEIMGKTIVYQGKAGSGQHTKMVNQIAIASGLVGVCEGLAYAKRAGLDPARVLSCIEKGAAASWSLSNYGPKMLAGDYGPGFYVKHFIKDMRIGAESAKRMGLETPGLDLAKSLYEKIAARGGELDGTQALFRLFDT
jgi:3-hydroxyisobutyrate dehydrogenase